VLEMCCEQITQRERSQERDREGDRASRGLTRSRRSSLVSESRSEGTMRSLRTDDGYQQVLITQRSRLR
jgi:hypothetical protein